MVVIKLFGDRVLEVDDTAGKLVAAAITSSSPPKFVTVEGQTLALADVTGIFTEAKWAEMQGEESVVVPAPPAVRERSKGNAPEWHWEQFDELKRRLAAGEKPGSGLWWAWIPDEADYRAAAAGDAAWPVEPISRAAKPGTSTRWVRKVVTERAYGQMYANRPGYHVLERYGTDVAIGYRRPWRPEMGAPSYQMPPGESWANGSEVVMLEDRVAA